MPGSTALRWECLTSADPGSQLPWSLAERVKIKTNREETDAEVNSGGRLVIEWTGRGGEEEGNIAPLRSPGLIWEDRFSLFNLSLSVCKVGVGI